MDTNFILTAIQNKVDVFEEFEGYKVLIPEEVIRELKSILHSDKKRHFKIDSELALRIIESKKHEKIKLGTKYVDKGIYEYAKNNPEVYIATLDKEIKRKLKGRAITLTNRKKIETV